MKDNMYRTPKSDLQDKVTICPICDQEMQSGYITSSSSIDWLAENQEMKSFSLTSGERLSAKGMVLSSAKVYGSRCHACKLSIIRDNV
jgi:hypothetical protein